MFMPKRPVSITLDEDNLIWLRGRAASRKRRSLSDAIDEIVTGVRTGQTGGVPSRSVVGTIDIAADDPALDQADSYVRRAVEGSLARPVAVREPRETYAVKAPKTSGRRKSGRIARG